MNTIPKMAYTSNMNNYKNTIIFIHGFKKDIASWNFDSKNKHIQIEESLSKKANTISIQFTEDDYCKPCSEICKNIMSMIKELKLGKIIIVAHSIGACYALKLAELDPVLFGKLLLIDPCIKTPHYYEYLKSKSESENHIEEHQLTHFEDLPSDTNIIPKVIIRIHFDYCDNSILDIPYFTKLTNKNMKSRLILHNDIGHMIHWKIPHVIIDSINELIKT